MYSSTNSSSLHLLGPLRTAQKQTAALAWQVFDKENKWTNGSQNNCYGATVFIVLSLWTQEVNQRGVRLLGKEIRSDSALARLCGPYVRCLFQVLDTLCPLLREQTVVQVKAGLVAGGAPNGICVGSQQCVLLLPAKVERRF